LKSGAKKEKYAKDKSKIADFVSVHGSSVADDTNRSSSADGRKTDKSKDMAHANGTLTSEPAPSDTGEIYLLLLTLQSAGVKNYK